MGKCWMFLQINKLLIFIILLSGCIKGSKCLVLKELQYCTEQSINKEVHRDDKLLVFKNKNAESSIRKFTSEKNFSELSDLLKMIVNRFFSEKEVPYAGDLSYKTACSESKKNDFLSYQSKEKSLIIYPLSANQRQGFPECEESLVRFTLYYGYVLCAKNKQPYEVRLFFEPRKTPKIEDIISRVSCLY